MKSRIMFVCHGNICRSPMAEFVLKDMVKKRGIAERFLVASSATSTEEIGNPVHRGTKRKLAQVGISTEGKYAVQAGKNDYDQYDYFVCMDQHNVSNLLRIFGRDPEHKIVRLLDFSKNPGDIADPWYTGDFDLTYRDVCDGCEALLEQVLKEG